jgi:hypothetical protein
MPIKKRFILFVLPFFIFVNGKAQEERLVQFTGRVFDEYIQPLSYAHVHILNSGRGTMTDNEGKFSFVTVEGDTILFSTMGFKKSYVLIPKNLEKPFFTRDVLMQHDTFSIAEVEIYPWKNYEEFKEAFLNLELPEDDLDRARLNIAMIKAQILMDNTWSASENYDYVARRNLYNQEHGGMVPTYKVFDVFAWAKFIEALKHGDFKNKNK